MKILKKIFLLGVCTFLLAGCGVDNNSGKKFDSGNSVDNVINSQIEKEEKKEEELETSTETESEVSMDTSEKQTEVAEQESKTEVDFDLTDMSSDMVYATVYQLMVAPEQYVGKTFRMEGVFYASYYELTQKHYYYCIIQDATACCAQGMEFVWEDGSHIYPDEYPKDYTEIIVEGTFETYREDGDNNLYCRLTNTIMKVKE